MKAWRIVLSVIFGAGLLAGMAIPFASAQEGASPEYVFHGEDVEARSYDWVEPPTPDMADPLLWTGEIQVYTGTIGMRFNIQNLCQLWSPVGPGTPTPSPTPVTPTPTGTITPLDCGEVDIYYTFTVSITWDKGNYSLEDPSHNFTPIVSFEYGGYDNMQTTAGEYCGQTLVGNGTCTRTITGVIPYEDWKHEAGGNLYDEKFLVQATSEWEGVHKVLTYSLSLTTTPPEISDCSGQYMQGRQIGTVTLLGTNGAGINLRSVLLGNYPLAGEYYVLKVNSGTWKNNGAGADLKTIGMKYGPAGALTQVGTNAYTECKDPNAETYYLQMIPTPESVYLSVYDTDGNWASNTGVVTVYIYSVLARTRYPSGCELLYKVGSLVESRTVPADSSKGLQLGALNNVAWPVTDPSGAAGQPVPKRYYKLEITGGPAYVDNAGHYSYDAELGRTVTSGTAPNTWYEATLAPFVTCAVQTDMIGHDTVYFAIEEQTDLYTFLQYYFNIRVFDNLYYGETSYTDNTGSISYNLYQASMMQTTLPGDTLTPTGCSAYSHDGTATGTYTLQGNDSVGTTISLPSLTFANLTQPSLYALITTAGPWKDNSIDSYAVQISNDNGVTWSDIQSYPGLLCAASADGYHVTIYVYGAVGQIWKARVKDGDSNYANNTLSIGLQVFAGTSSAEQWVTCHDKYTTTLIPLSDLDRMVDAKTSGGVDVPQITQGQIYSIEITGAWKWYEAGTGPGSYLVDISPDNGATWIALETYGRTLCTEQIGEVGRFQIWFTAQSNAYLLRVRDTDGVWNTNTNSVMYNLYSAFNSANPPSGPPGTNPPGVPPPEWVVACSEAYKRPDTFLTWYPLGTIAGVTISAPIPRVGEWIDYLRSAVTYYFAWCPQHTAALQGLGQNFEDKEPLASLNTLMTFVQGIKTRIAAATGGADSDILVSQEPDLFSDTDLIGQPGGAGTPKDTSGLNMFLIGNLDPATNIWKGGRVDFNASMGTYDSSADAAYIDLCSTKFYDLFGVVSDPMCNFLAHMRSSQLMSYLLLIIDFVVIIWFALKYMPGYVKRGINVLNRNAGGVSKVANNL